MEIQLLQAALKEAKIGFEHAITTATYTPKGKSKPEKKVNGKEAKTSFVRGHRFISPVHEAIKKSLRKELHERDRSCCIHPPVGESNPELKFLGFIKGKKQDVIVLFDGDRPKEETVDAGPLAGRNDPVGEKVSQRALVINARSQISSIGKNIDTMTERLFAETLNLRLRLPELVMGEVYVVAIPEYDEEAMEENKVKFKKPRTEVVERFIMDFAIFSGRQSTGYQEYQPYTGYKYERSALAFADFRRQTPKIYCTLDELKKDRIVSTDFSADFASLSPRNFVQDLLDIHRRRHGVTD